ncbi:MAG: class I SAM-dependent methyltransferase [Synergistaceae bacterium]|nr:class I SAM-dependent methyltransferase [Synergistaceae bacterium]
MEISPIIDSGLRTQDSGYLNVKFEDYQRERLDEIYDIIVPYSEMEKNARYFLNGIIRYFKPAKILEVGVSQGGGTALILNAIKDLDSQLISVDYCEKYYAGGKDNNKLSGWLVDEKFSHLKDKWQIYRGGDISRFIERVGGDIDLLVLDTAHLHPWETLNFLCVLPFMKRESWCVLHDVSLNYLPGRENDLACRYLFSYVVSDYKIMPAPEKNIPHFANIGAFRITDDTVKYVRNLFESLLNPWQAIPGIFDKKVFRYGTPILSEDIDSIKIIFAKYYPDYVKFFDNVIDFQQGIAQHKIDAYNSFKGVWKRYFPLSFIALRAIKRILTGKK